MKTFEKFTKEIDESDIILSEARRYFGILIEKDSEQYKQYKKNRAKFQKTFGKNIRPTVVQPGLNLYKAGGPFIPDKTTYKDTGKKVPKMEPKPQFGKPKPVTKTGGAPDKTLLKQAIKDVKASEKRLFDKGLGKGTAGVRGVKGKSGISLARQRRYTLDKIKELSADTTKADARIRGSSTEGSAGASSSSKTVTPTKGVNQADVSKKAQDFTQEIDAKKKIKDAIVKKKSTKSKSDVNRIAQNKIDIEKANQFKKTDAYKNIVQGKDSQGNYLTPQQRKKKFKEFQANLKNAKQNVDKKVTQGAAPDYVAKSGSKSKGATYKSKGFKSTATAGGNRVTMNTTTGARSGPRSVSKPPTSRFRKIVDKVRTSKIGSKVIKGLSKSRYGKIAGVALGVAGTAAGISALNRPKSGKGTKLDFSKDIVRGPSIRNLVKNDKGKLVAGKPKRFQLGQKVTMDDLKNTTFTKKLTDKQLAYAKGVQAASRTS